MAVETDVTVTGADETKEAFIERWGNLSDEEREKAGESMFSETRGLNRKVTELHAKLDELRGEKQSATATTEKAVSTLDELRDEIAEVRAAKLLVQKQSAMLARAGDRDIDPKLALAFAETSDPDGVFELAVSEIERRAQSQVNERLSATPVPRSGNLGSGYNLENMTKAERDRLPASIRDRAFNDYLTEVV